MKLLTILFVLLSFNTFAGDYGQDVSKDCNTGDQGNRNEKQISRSTSSSETPVKPKAERK